MRDAANKKAKETGKTIWDVCLSWIYDPELTISQQQTAWKMFADKFVIQASEGGEADRDSGPTVYLPGQRPDLEVIEGGKESE